MKTLNIYRVVASTKAEGPGKRVSVWFQGCRRHCPGCFAKETWSFEENQLYTPQDIAAYLDRDSSLEGITILGGEPFEQPEGLLQLLMKVKAKGKSTIVFTGYMYEELYNAGNAVWKEIFQYVDVLVDGEYRQELRSFEVPMVGSSNQRYWFLTNRYTMQDFPENKIEAIIEKDGTICFNGMGDFGKLEKIMRRRENGI